MAEAEPTAIREFRADNYTLSNFYPCVVTYEGQTYPSVEHAFQAAKTLDPAKREEIRSVSLASEAKRLGRKVKLRPDWETVKLGIMEELLRSKFSDKQMMGRLLRTKPLLLVEGNHWGDTYWGVCDGVGQNWLGILLMKIRDE